MLAIILSLLSGWILALFNFDVLVIDGVLELFGQTITKTGYYFIFGMAGLVKSILSFINVKTGLNKISEEITEKANKKFK